MLAALPTAPTLVPVSILRLCLSTIKPCHPHPPTPCLQCHKAKNVMGSGGQKPSKTARAVVELQVRRRGGGVAGRRRWPCTAFAPLAGSIPRVEQHPFPKHQHSSPLLLRPSPALPALPALPCPAPACSALQEQLPDAKVLYSSATGASEPRNLGYMTRLGLWGAKDAVEFIDLLSK